MSYDAWLEKPFQDECEAQEREEAFEEAIEKAVKAEFMVGVEVPEDMCDSCPLVIVADWKDQEMGCSLHLASLDEWGELFPKPNGKCPRRQRE